MVSEIKNRLPSNWSFRSVDELGKVVTGSTPKTSVSEYWGGKYPFVSPTDISENKYVFDTQKTVTELGMQQGRVIPPDSVLVTCIASIGKLALSSHECITNQQINSIIPFDSTDAHYLYYCLSYMTPQLRELAGTTAVPIVNKTIFSKFQVPVPLLPEQSKIAAILTSVDEAIAATQRIIDQTEIVKRGLMQKLFTKGIGHTTFKQTEIGEIPKEWDVVTIGDVLVDCQYGLSESLSTEPIGIPVLRMNNIQSGTVMVDDLKYLNVEESSIQRYLLNMGDILFNRTNSQDLVGKTGIFKHDGAFTFASYLIRIRGDSGLVNQDFLNYYMNSNDGQDRIRAYMSLGVSQSNINATNLKKVYLPLPPLKEQQAIVEVLSSVDAKMDAESNILERLNVLKQGLMQVLLAGKVRVTVDELSEVSV